MKEVIDTVSVALANGQPEEAGNAGGQPYVALGRCG